MGPSARLLTLPPYPDRNPDASPNQDRPGACQKYLRERIPKPKPEPKPKPKPKPNQDRLDEGMARSIFESERQLADMAVRARPEA